MPPDPTFGALSGVVTGAKLVAPSIIGDMCGCCCWGGPVLLFAGELLLGNGVEVINASKGSTSGPFTDEGIMAFAVVVVVDVAKF